ncbi:beta-galactosidase, partial [bacterium]
MVNNRTRLSLDGQWQFWTDPDDSLDTASLLAASASQVHVPAPWQSQSSKLISYTGVAWYQRTLEIPIDWIGSGRILLGIDASDYKTEVWFNGMKVGEHEGGYLPFESDVTLAAFAGENTLTIRVDDPPAIFPEVPHGKQGWYGPLS